MKKKACYSFLFFFSFFVFAQEMGKERFVFQNQFGDIFEYSTASRTDSPDPGIKDKCGCHQGPSQATTLLGSCCWTTPSVTAPTCVSAAGTGRSCI